MLKTKYWVDKPDTHRPNEHYRLKNEEDLSLTENYSPTYQSTHRQVVLEWKNITVRAKASRPWSIGKTSLDHPIISNVSGIARPGQLLAIMGTSGCGKTTLINALTQRSQGHLDVEGDVLVDGRLISPGQIDAISAYVQQDDLFGGMLTVREELTFQATLRMEKRFTYSQKMQRVQEILEELELTSCQDTRIGVPGIIQGISGGERRRLAFAAEVLTDPLIMFCDEPTTGLDTAMAENVVIALKKMATKGKTILCTIHQPSSYQYTFFDRLLLMAKGRLVFLGTPDEALELFSRLAYPCPLNYNPADHFIQVLTGINENTGELNEEDVIQKLYQRNVPSGITTTDFGKQIVDTDVTNTEHLKNGVTIHTKSSRFHASVGTQLRTVIWRFWLCVIRDKKLLKIRIFESSFLGIFFGLLYKDQHYDLVAVPNVTGFFAQLVSVLSFQYIFQVMESVYKEAPLFFRENGNGLYRTEVYVLSKWLVDVPTTVCYTFLLCIFPLWMMGVADAHELTIMIVVNLVVAASCGSIGCFLACLTGSISAGMTMTPFFTTPASLCCGYFINIRSLPSSIAWLKHFSWYKYGIEGLSIAHWKDVTHFDCGVNNATCPKNGLTVLNLYDYKPNNLDLDIWAMVGMAVGYRMLGWAVLSFRARRRN